MTEIQELIASLQSKMKKQLEMLIKMENDAASIRNLLANDRQELKRIIDSMPNNDAPFEIIDVK